MALLVRALVAAAVTMGMLLLHAAAPTAQRAATEAQIKAVFLYNFAKYVDWPSAPAGSSDTIRMCVTADDRFLGILREAVRDEIVNGRPLTATAPEDLDAARECDVLYVGNAATRDAASWIAATRGRHTLTVGDGRLVDGLVIAFVRDQERVRFDINRAAASRRQLSISSRLLDLARRVVEP